MSRLLFRDMGSDLSSSSDKPDPSTTCSESTTGAFICLLTTTCYSTDVVLDSTPNDTTTIGEALRWLLSASLAPSYLRGFVRFSD